MNRIKQNHIKYLSLEESFGSLIKKPSEKVSYYRNLFLKGEVCIKREKAG